MTQNKSTQILFVLPTPRDRSAIDLIDSKTAQYDFHWVDDPSFQYLTSSSDFNLLRYIETCSDYIKEHHIEAILYSHDLASLVAAALCERHHLPGPSVESMFLCTHKYYSRKHEASPIWFDYIPLDGVDPEKKITQFPVYFKPPCLLLTLFQYKINNKSDLYNALTTVQSELPSWNKMYHDFFRAFVDLKKYPLADQNILLIEELVENASQHCVEGWVEPDGTILIWALSDQNYYPDGRLAIDNYSTPSFLPHQVQEKIIAQATQTVQNHGIRNGFWNVELWLKNNGECFITEINSRSASVWHHLYQGTYGKSLYQAMIYLATGEIEKCRALAPFRQGDSTKQYGGQFHIITYGEGRADEFLDYEKVRATPEINTTLFVPEKTEIKQTRTSGFWLGRFELFGDSYEEICNQASEYRNKVLRKPEQSPRGIPVHYSSES